MGMLEFDSQACTSYVFCIADSNYKQSCAANASFAFCNRKAQCHYPKCPTAIISFILHAACIG